MSKIRVRLLGGFEVWYADQQVGRFESQKVRALLAYLVCNRDRPSSRDQLAGLLWPEKDPDTARHALRQAVYNLRATLPGADSTLPPVLTSHADIRLNPESPYWFDVQEFEDALRGGTGQSVDLLRLSRAVQLYRGDLLPGFFVRDSPEFEAWLTTERERLRESAVDALRTLIESYRRRGEYRFGLHYARQLVALDPLSEPAHGALMRLFVLAGRRSRALAHYEELQHLLRDELGVEPAEETRALYQEILSEASDHEPEGEPIGPLIPLVGRRDVYRRLRETWEQVLTGQSRLTLVGGEAGVGKTRLIKSFLDATTSRHRSVVLKGRGYELAPEIPYLTVLEVLRNALAEEEQRARAVVAGLSGEDVRALSRLLPELANLRPELTGSILLATPAARLAVFRAVSRFLAGLRRGRDGGPGEPLVLFFDDLHYADPASFDLLEHLLAELDGFPFWVVASVRPEDLRGEHRLAAIARRAAAAGRLDELPVERLDRAAIDEVAVSLVGEDQAPELAGFLAEHGAGLPLALAELINYLWDEGALTAQSASSWNLAHPLDVAPSPSPPPGGLDALILRRIRRLPNSTRRLVAVAAVVGQSFDPELLQDAAEEHPAVIEVGLEVMLRRWLVRQLAPYWTSNRREPDIVLWAKGARRGTFEFAHKMIRQTLYHDMDPARRRAVHLQVAEGLERLRGDATAQVCEALAYHFLAAGADERALPYLEKAAERARYLMAGATARAYAEQALGVIERLAAAEGRSGRERWRDRRDDLQRLRDLQRA